MSAFFTLDKALVKRILWFTMLVSSAAFGTCNPGTYASGTACVNAPVGYYVPSAGATGPTPCPPGTWQNNAGQSHCVVAGSGTYVSGYAAGSASTCTGSYSTSVAGTYSPGGNIHTWPDQYTTVGPTTCAVMTQVQCNPGYYAQPGAAACSAVPAGFYTPSAGATAPIPCPPGTWQKNGAQNHCVVAGSNTYVSSYAAGAANGCPAGTSSVSVAGQYVSGGSIHTWPDQFTTVGPTTCN